MRPATGEERALSPEVNALADVYALMIFQRTPSYPLDMLAPEALALIDSWRKAAEGNAA
jgi:hypothetical protein